MNANRWFWSVTAVLSVNVLLVAASGIRAHMHPQDGLSALAQTDGSESPQKATQLPPANETPHTENLPTEIADRSPSLDPGVPSVPSLEEVPEQVPNDVKNDPVYQELKKMFSESGGSFESPPMIDQPSGSTLPELPLQPKIGANAVPSQTYFARLDRRLQSATQLCETARSVAAEAAVSAEAGDNQNAAELLNMATQLREMAANLITRQL